jgi:hypothetical protein
VLQLRTVLVVAAVAACVALVLILRPIADDEDVPVVPTPSGATRGEPVADPFAWTPERSGELARRAAAGTSHVLYTRSPGGAVATAERVAPFRPLVERAAETAGVSPDLLEALVFLESGGRPDAQAPGGAEAAAGLTQILAETGQNLLGMKVDVERSGRYTRRIAHATKPKRIAALERARARVDERFDPAKALEATARYLTMARERFGREDLAFVSYHMGMGNLESVLAAYGAGRRPYAELYFASTPTRHAAAYRKLASFGDDSSNYFWKLQAARDIMRVSRADPGELARRAAAHGTDEDGRRRMLLDGAPQGDLRPLPNVPDDTALTAEPDVELRPEALGVALYVGVKVRVISQARALGVTQARDGGWTFLVSRRYASRRQARAFQYVLDRLQVLDVIAWSRSPRSISVTASRDAKVLEPLLDRLEDS